MDGTCTQCKAFPWWNWEVTEKEDCKIPHVSGWRDHCWAVFKAPYYRCIIQMQRQSWIYLVHLDLHSDNLIVSVMKAQTCCYSRSNEHFWSSNLGFLLDRGLIPGSAWGLHPDMMLKATQSVMGIKFRAPTCISDLYAISQAILVLGF